MKKEMFLLLAYKKQGTGPAIVFVHGFLSGGHSFDFIIEDLAATHTVYVVDLPGIGESQIEKSDYQVEDYAKEVAEVLEQEGVDEAVWVGHSMGGYVALAAVDEKIAPVSQLVLLFSSDLADGEEAREKREKQKGEIREKGVDVFVDSMIENFFPEGSSEESIDYMRKVAKYATPEGMVYQLTAMQQRPERTTVITEGVIPVAIIEGTNDSIMKPIETDGPNVQKVRIPTGHMGMVEKPALVIDAIRMVLAKDD